MSAAPQLPPSTAPPSTSSGVAMLLWQRVGAMMKAAWRRPNTPSARPSAVPADGHDPRLPVARKIVAISASGTQTRPERLASPVTATAATMARNETRHDEATRARRPGMQNRWKASDRVAAL